jgi:hypothetical protein
VVDDALAEAMNVTSGDYAADVDELGAPLQVHEVGVQPALGGGEAGEHRGALHVEPHALQQHAGEDAQPAEVEATETEQDHPPDATHHGAPPMARARAAISVSPRAANARATRSMPDGALALRAWNNARR